MAEAENEDKPFYPGGIVPFQDALQVRQYELMARDIHHEYNDNLSDKLDRAYMDNHPGKWPTQWGKNASDPSYYYLQEPGEWNYWKMGRYTPYGFRIVWVTTYDVWNNLFTIDITGLSDQEERDKNDKLTKHLRKIKFYKAFMRGTGFDSEQGESIVYIHRMGEDMGEQTKDGYHGLESPDDDDIPVNRLEAISRLYYTIPRLESYGDPAYFRVSFYQDFGGRQAFSINPDRAIRIKTQELDYEFYRGQSILKSVFPTIQALLVVDRALADFAHRYGTGSPIFVMRGIRNQADRLKMKAAITAAQQGKFGLFPAERLDRIDMLGQGNVSDNIVVIKDAFIRDISMATGIPNSVLLGEGDSGETEDIQYFKFLDKKQGALEPGIREYFTKDPFIREEILEGREYKIVWGLQHVRSAEAQVEFDTKVGTVIQEFSPYLTINQLLAYANYPSIEERWESGFTQKYFGVDNETLGTFPAGAYTKFVDLMALERQMQLEKKYGVLLPETDTPEKGAARSQTELKPQGRTPTTKPRSQAELAGSEIKKTKLNDAQIMIAEGIMNLKDEVGKRDMWTKKLVPWSNQKNDQAIAWAEDLLSENDV